MQEHTTVGLMAEPAAEQPRFRDPSNINLTEAQLQAYYDKLGVFDEEHGEAKLFKKPASLHVPYMWKRGEELPETSEHDEVFLAQRHELESHGLFGYHTYGGYWIFFRPDLNEVIRLISTIVPPEDLERTVTRVWVTTQPYPNDNVREVYDRARDKHRAKTTVVILRSTVTNKRRADELTSQEEEVCEQTKTTSCGGLSSEQRCCYRLLYCKQQRS